MSDETKTISAQLGRPARAKSEVVSRCHLGLPVVLAVPPVLDTGEPFPTRYWLSCPLAHRRVARLEAGGAIQRYRERLAEEPDLAAAVEAAHARYAAERDALLTSTEGPRPRGGVAGAARGIKCLHAHYAHHRGGGENVVGAEVAERVEPLNCAVPCVRGGCRNAEWREPRTES